MGVALTLQAKGVYGVAARARTLLSRLGPTPRVMQRSLDEYVDLVATFAARPTFAVPACLVARYPALFRQLRERGVELALHGLIHNDHAALDLAEQRASIARGVSVFAAAGLPCAGFRGPYLRSNPATHQAAWAAGLAYQSSQAVVFDVVSPERLPPRAAAAFRRALRLYGALPAGQHAVRPRSRSGVIDIPIALPDDEILVDRLGSGPDAQAAAWLGILDQTHASGDLFTMQLHPERIRDCADALRALLAAARRKHPPVWIARLDEIAGWWRSRQQAALRVQAVAVGRYQVDLEGPPEATLFVRSPGEPGEACWGRDRIAAARSITLESPVKPVIGLSPRTMDAVHAFLREEGWPVEVEDDPARVALYLDLPEGADERALLARIEDAPGLLVRLWRWPGGARSALAVTGDIDAITIQDYALRILDARWARRETARAIGARRA